MNKVIIQSLVNNGFNNLLKLIINMDYQCIKLWEAGMVIFT